MDDDDEEEEEEEEIVPLSFWETLNFVSLFLSKRRRIVGVETLIRRPQAGWWCLRDAAAAAVSG